jgi:hypothetical protein
MKHVAPHEISGPKSARPWAQKKSAVCSALALLSQASQAGPTLVAATGATMTTTAARQLLRGRSPFRGEWDVGAHPVFPFWRAHTLRSRSEGPFQKKSTEFAQQ